MSYPNYAKTNRERIWVADEATFNTLAHPAAADALRILPGAAIPTIVREFAESQERAAGAGVPALIGRKKPPQQWTIPMYLGASLSAGTPPKCGLLLKKGFGVETIVGATSVTYSLASAIEEQSFSIWQYLDNGLHGYRGCLTNAVRIELSGSDEGRLTLSGWAQNEVMVGVGALAAQILDVASPPFVIQLGAGEARRFLAGPAATDTIKVLIDSEIFLCSSVIDYTLDQLNCTARAQDTTSAATHNIGAVVGPVELAADPEADNAIMPITLGDFKFGGVAYLGVGAVIEVNNNLEVRIDEYGTSVGTGFRRTAERRRVTGTVRAYGLQDWQRFMSNPHREVTEAAAFSAGDLTALGAKVTVNVDRLRITGITKDTGGVELMREFAWQGMPSAPENNDELTLVYE